MGMSMAVAEYFQSVTITHWGTIVTPVQCGRGEETQPRLFGGTAEACRRVGRGLRKEIVRDLMVIVPLKSGRDSEVGINQESRHGEDPPLRWLAG